MKRWLVRQLPYFLVLLFLGCQRLQKDTPKQLDEHQKKYSEVEANVAASVIKSDTLFVADSFDFPVGKPDGKGYYNAQPFGEHNHLGDDWNARTGGNSDLGDPIYAIGNGKVNFAQDMHGGWGKVVRIIHTLPDGREIESLYAHCDRIVVEVGELVTKGMEIATVGTANGQYYAHLHLEIRHKIGMPLGGGYGTNTEGYVDPTEFIKTHRKIEN